ncbi:MAG: DUF2281 domain-containing protein [Hydrococcus sp. RU_2_2]|nr:DUF2281 domain-containing protein [Hydrococcus sp. RU_2_2]
MSLEQAVLEKLRDLSPQQQKEVLDFAEFLQQKTSNHLWTRQRSSSTI